VCRGPTHPLKVTLEPKSLPNVQGTKARLQSRKGDLFYVGKFG